MRRLTEQDILQRFDKNGDGKLDEEEVAAAHEAMMKAQLERRAQRKEDKQAGLPPGGRIRAAGQAIRAQLLARFDQNGDGRLDDAEWAQAAPLLRQRIEHAPGMMRRFDTNHDGTLDDTEWAAASAQLHRLVNQPATAGAK